MADILIYRPGTPPTLQATVSIDEKTVFSKRLMGEWNITSEFYSNFVLDIAIGDYIVYDSANYYINRLPDVTKLNNATYQYRIDFESEVYDLNKKLFISSDGLAEYSYNGKPLDFVTNIVANINLISSGWTVGTIDDLDERTLQFSNESCHSALTRVAKEFDLEYEIIGKSISLKAAVGSVTALSFQYGRGLGLYKLERQQVSDQNIVTKVFGFGGTQNIPYTYRSGAKRLVFETGGLRYLTKNVSLYGTIEGQFTDDEIYPKRTSTLTASHMNFDNDGTNFNSKTSYIEDSAMDFDINSYLIEGVRKIVFKSGDLSGIECEIWKYDNANKRFYINPYSDTDGYTLPFYNSGSPFQPEIGDSYTLIGISMPASYVTAAETALQVATQAFIDENSVPMVVYSVEIDRKYAKSIGLSLDAGDKVTIVDTALGVNSLIRVAGVTFPIVNAYNIKAVIADFVPYTLQERLIKTTILTRKETVFVDMRNVELARRNTMRQNQLKTLLFDTDGYFDPENIKPLSIETMYLSVGARSSDFWLNNVTIKANYGGDANAFYISTGTLTHLQIEITGLGSVWVIGSALSQSSLTPTSAYYLYAKCSKSALTGVWVLSTSQITIEEVAGYYHFLVGMLFAVLNSARDFDFTHGMTYINGNTIITGKIKSIDDNNYFDLTQSQFRIGDANSSLDWNVTARNTLTIKGALVQRPAGTFPVLVFTGAYSGSVIYQKGDQATDDGSSWNYINNTPASGHTPAEGAYWTEVAIGGASGTNGVNGAAGSSPAGVYRGIYNGTSNYYGTTHRRDIVSYSGLYYIAQINAGNPFSGHAPTDTSYWNPFGANLDSVATSLLFAELAYIDNLGVKYFRGNPVGSGNLAGSVAATQANTTGTPRIDQIILSGTDGSALITCSGVSKSQDFMASLNGTAIDFIANWYADYEAVGVAVTHSGGTLIFTEINGENFSGSTGITNTSGSLNGTPSTTQAHTASVKRIDTVTLTGTGGMADILCDGNTKRATFVSSLTQTATNFVTANAGSYLTGGVVLTSSGADLIFTALYAGVNFTGSTTITNVASTFTGAVSIAGNDIWENETDGDNLGSILFNRIGYNGGATRLRRSCFYNGKGIPVLYVGTGIVSGSETGIYSFADEIYFQNIPASASGSDYNRVYHDVNGFLKVII